jgi:hypothetical protein
MRFALITIGVLAIPLSGCEKGPQLPHVQFCLSRTGDAKVLKETIRRIAKEERIQFFDWSSRTEELLRSDPGSDINQSFPLINVGLRRKDGLGVGGGNAGLPANQVSFGFTEGSSRAEAERFSQKVISRLSQTWNVQRVADGVGARPLKGCASLVSSKLTSPSEEAHFADRSEHPLERRL